MVPGTSSDFGHNRRLELQQKKVVNGWSFTTGVLLGHGC